MLPAPALLSALLYPTPRCASAYFDPSAGGRRGRRGSAPDFRRAVPPGRQGALQRVRAQAAAAPARPEEKAEAAPGGAGGEWGPAAGRAVSRLRQTGADEGGVRRAAVSSPRGNDGSVGARCSGRRDGAPGGTRRRGFGWPSLRARAVARASPAGAAALKEGGSAAGARRAELRRNWKWALCRGNAQLVLGRAGGYVVGPRSGCWFLWAWRGGRRFSGRETETLS